MRHHLTHKTLLALAIGFLLMANATYSAAQNTKPDEPTAVAQLATEKSDDSVETISVFTRMVSITASGTDRKGRPQAFNASTLKLYADEQPQEIAAADVESPSQVAILVDTSSSMRGEKTNRVKEAVREFLNAADPRNLYTLIAFNEKVSVLGHYSQDRNSLKPLFKTLHDQPRAGQTALYDACAEAVRIIRQSSDHRKPALIVFTDGEDNTSRLTAEQLGQILDDFNGQVFVVLLDDKLASVNPLLLPSSPQSALYAAHLRSTLNGHTYLAHSQNELWNISDEIARSLSLSVRLNFYPTGDAAQSGSHNLRIESLQPSIFVQSRSHYFVN